MDKPSVIVIGAGFTGLAAAYELSKAGLRVLVLESDASVGGLAGGFDVPGQRLEKFYHHWFTNDTHITNLVNDLGVSDHVIHRPTRTGSYYANKVFRLSTPLDLLKYTPISLIARIRLGLLVLRARRVRNWEELESLTAVEWIEKLAGKEVLEKVWRPLLEGKFGPFTDRISAVWFWNKVVLRGGSRGKAGQEVLAYFKGGFLALAELMAKKIEEAGGQVQLDAKVERLVVEDGRVVGCETNSDQFVADQIVSTVPLPVHSKLVAPFASPEYVQEIDKVEYLGNVCLVLQLDRSLSDTYWINVSDPSFPYVGIIEHTNFEPKETYDGRHIVYLSKYLPTSAELYGMDAEEALEYSLPHITRMFPDFDRSWILDYHVFKAEYSQPIVERHYSKMIPAEETPFPGLWLTTMAQIYPEDRGTNYAIREGRRVGKRIADLSK